MPGLRITSGCSLNILDSSWAIMPATYQAGNVDIVRDHLAFEMFPVFLSETEVQSLGQALNAALRPYLKNGPSPERRRSILGLMAIPDFAVVPLSVYSPAVEAAEAKR